MMGWLNREDGRTFVRPGKLMLFYYIQSLAPGSSVLSIDPDAPAGNLVVMPKAVGDQMQLWQAIMLFGSNAPLGIALVNSQSGLAASAPAENSPVSQVAIANADTASFWDFKPGTYRGQSFTVIRLLNRTTQNLTGASNGTVKATASVQGWSGGPPAFTQTWVFVPADFDALAQGV
jgi:hypothetical protein